MAVNKDQYRELSRELSRAGITLVAVSKTKPVSDILELYELGQRDFGENYVQELLEKQPQLPPDIRWHFIGHLQRNKVKYLAPFIHLIHGVDNFALLQEINRQGELKGRIIPCLLQVHIAVEETKFGLSSEELMGILEDIGKRRAGGTFAAIELKGLMGMASFTEDAARIRQEFKQLKAVFDKARNMKGLKGFEVLSMGMSSDYRIAIEEGTTLVRIGSLLFGAREKS
jgi:pyridoxal phosphate enzyme (YggS family)